MIVSGIKAKVISLFHCRAICLVSLFIFGVIAGVVALVAIPQITQADPGDCDPITDLCILGLTPNVGSTDGGANIGSNQADDGEGNQYDAPSYDPNEPMTLTYSGGYNFGQYQYLEYVSFTGTQYINTGINYLTSDDIIRMDIDVLNTRGTHGIDPPTTSLEQISGVRQYMSSSQNWRFFISLYSGSGFNGTYWSTVGTSITNVNAVNLGNPVAGNHEWWGVEYNRNTMTNTGYRGNTAQNSVILGYEPTDSNGDPANIGPLFLGAVNNGSFGVLNPGYWTEQDVYGFKIWKEGNLVADYKPVWNVIAQEYGFYDEINRSFLASNTGDSLDGPLIDSNGQPVNMGGISATATIDFTLGGVQVGTCDNITFVNESQLTCVPSAWDTASGIPTPDSQSVDVNLTIDAGIPNSDTLTAGYTYRAPMNVTSLAPNIGPVTGNEIITIDGRNFLPPDFSSDWALVDYVEFKGAAGSMQYIDTDIQYLVGDNSIRIDLDAAYTRTGGTGNLEQLTGFRANSGSEIWRFFISQYQTNLWANHGTITTTNGVPLGSITPNVRTQLGIDHVRGTSLGSGYRNGVFIGSKAQAAPTFNTKSMLLGAANDQNGPNYSSNYKVYGFKITKNGVVVANYIPMKNTSTGECGFWDTASFTFKSNNGVGNLTCGDEVGYQVTDVTITIDHNPSALCFVESVSNTDIFCTVPPGTVGVKDITIETDHEIITVEDGYTYAPVVSSVSTPYPSGGGFSNIGPTTGGNTITVWGLGFEDGGVTTPTVMVGDVACANVTVLGPDELTCDIPTQTPEHAPGTVNVIVTINGVDSIPASSATDDDYIFRAPMKITSVTPNQGVINGGTTVTIVGTNLLPPDGISTDGRTVTFDPSGTAAPCTPITSWTNTQIKCTTSAHVEGLVDVKASNTFESAVLTNGFKYITISLSLASDQTDIKILVPGTEAFDSNTYTVNTGSIRGYNLTIQANKITSSSVTHIPANPDVVATGSCTSTGAKFLPISATGALTNNRWGWKASPTTPTQGNTDWEPMTSDAQTIASPTAPSASGGDSYKVHFGARTDYNQPACTYEIDLFITAVVKP